MLYAIQSRYTGPRVSDRFYPGPSAPGAIDEEKNPDPRRWTNKEEAYRAALLLQIKHCNLARETPSYHHMVVDVVEVSR